MLTDPCLHRRDDGDAFESIYVDKIEYFRILRCREHGEYFLEDVRGGVGLYEVLIHIGPDIGERKPREIWNAFHRRPLEELKREGRVV